MPKESLPPSPLDSSSTSAAAPAAAAAASSMNAKRTAGVLSWDDTFLFMSSLAARRSKDPSTQVGACIVDADNRIVSIGYNGFPRNCSDDSLPWGRTAADPLDTKYPYVVHAEANAILNKNAASVRGARLYVGLFPCNECAKLIIQSGIVEVVYACDKYRDAMPFVAARRMFSLAGVKTRFHAPAESSLTLHVVDDDSRTSVGGGSDVGQLTTAPSVSPAAAASEGRRIPSPVMSTPVAAPAITSPAPAEMLSPTSAARARAISEAEGKD